MVRPQFIMKESFGTPPNSVIQNKAICNKSKCHRPIALRERLVTTLVIMAASPGHHMEAKLPARPNRPRESSIEAIALRIVSATRKTKTQFLVRRSQGTVPCPTSG